MKDTPAHVTILNLPSSSDRLPLFIVGDVHGCARELSELILLAKKTTPIFQLVLIGDLFTKGPDPIGVFELIHEHTAICIKGNHDWALKALISKSQKSSKLKIAHHSQQTLNLIRYHKNLIADFILKLPYAITTKVEPNFKRQGWETNYPMIVLHAGFDPIRGLQETSERILLTARYMRFDMKNDQKVLIPVTLNEMHTIEEKVFRWHEFHYGPELIVFGHDAKQGLFRKTLSNGRPICIGLDTGCTYGKFLTGYFPELDFAIQVKSHRKYFDAKENIILTK